MSRGQDILIAAAGRSGWTLVERFDGRLAFHNGAHRLVVHFNARGAVRYAVLDRKWTSARTRGDVLDLIREYGDQS